EEVLASGLLGGELGTFIESQLDSNQIQRNFYHIQGQTRNCIAILHEGQQTEILEQGPTVSTDEAAEFKTYLETQLLN
ncbi:PfkB family carbohydrate kinase, partial [Staphylococcus epidermidis]|uniref:PfkB family carbohydrate kinase n=1 Tax=Staphylococcus epidermidis TaxID=1282 RepID=UPI0030BA4A6A